MSKQSPISPSENKFSLNNLIATFSLTFIKNWRLTILLLVSTVVLGFSAYGFFLQREGFPEIEVPGTIIATPYYVDDPQQVEKDVTQPITDAVSELAQVEEIQTTTSDNFSTILVFFPQGEDVDDGVRLIKDTINREVQLPKDATPMYNTFDAGTIDGKHEMIISLITNGKSLEQAQEKAEQIAQLLENSDAVIEANAIEQVTERVNPVTGETILAQESFKRVGERNDKGMFVFQNAVDIGLVRNKDLGTIEFSEKVREEVDGLQDELEGYEISYGGDLFAEILENQIDGLESNAVSGLIAVIVILLLLVSWRASIVSSLFIPTVMAASFFVLWVTGNTLNTLTLFSLILVLGLIVDDAIVVVEAIDYQKKQGDKGLSAIRKAISRIGVADVLGTITTLLVFAPMLFVTGILGGFIVFIPLTVIITLTMSLLIGLSFIPFLSNFLIPDRKVTKHKSMLRKYLETIFFTVSNLTAKAGEKIAQMVRSYLAKPIWGVLIVVLGLVLVAAGAYTFNLLKFSIFAPPKDADTVMLTVNYQPDSTVSEAESIAEEIDEIVLEEVGDNLQRIDYFDANQNSATVYVQLKKMEKRQETAESIQQDLESEFENFTLASVKVDVMGIGPPPTAFPFAVQIYDEDQGILEEVSTEIASYLDGRTIKDSDGEEVEEVRVEFLNTIARRNGERYAQVRAKIDDPTNTALINSIQEMVKEEFDEDRLKQLGASEDVLGFDFGMETEMMESFESALLVLIVALIVMYALLVVLYSSFSQPLIIFTAIIFSFPGLFPGLWLTKNAFGFFSLLGIMALAGIVVNNTIMLVDYANQEQANGKDIRNAIAEAIKVRFRPLLTTSLTTVAGLIPLALSDPIWEPLAYSIIFGLLSSTLFVVTIFPAYYGVLEYVRKWVHGLWYSVRK